ncbi:hypothetical protein AB0O03_03615 [Streptomyces diastaticus]|uniref:Uncharacterized protein n=1 Tax=Streptomyces gougerotii TaxID=53448 RepID=A0A8H9HKX2_9ACTN|nr:hypothetical protein GCM10010227_26260 [Streptomyces gougerotii]
MGDTGGSRTSAASAAPAGEERAAATGARQENAVAVATSRQVLVER